MWHRLFTYGWLPHCLSFVCYSLGMCLVLPQSLDKHYQAIVKQVLSICQLLNICLTIACQMLCPPGEWLSNIWQASIMDMPGEYHAMDRQHQADEIYCTIIHFLLFFLLAEDQKKQMISLQSTTLNTQEPTNGHQINCRNKGFEFLLLSLSM